MVTQHYFVGGLEIIFAFLKTLICPSTQFMTYNFKIFRKDDVCLVQWNKPKVGFPTGACISRQEADIFLHWLIHITLKDKINLWPKINKWLRFIDDVFGIWKGKVRQFNKFVEELNKLTNDFGIPYYTKLVEYIN